MRALSRQEFERQVFERDGHMCLICGEPAVDAHHILDRGLWVEPDEKFGYLVDNGASLCERHHIAAEKNYIAPQALRRAAYLPTVVPKQLDRDEDYSKWGYPFKQATRESAKYPSTSYLDVSPSQPKPTDRNSSLNTNLFKEMPLVITTKMDGSNVVLRHTSMGARNGDTANHRSFDQLKAIHAVLKYRIDPWQEVFCEWLYAKHSIHYTGDLALPHLLQVIAVYDMYWRVWLSWDETVEIADSLDLPTVPLIARGALKEWEIVGRVVALGNDVINEGHEGIVIRNEHSFHSGQFTAMAAKYVREDHVQTDEHWMNSAIVTNEAKK